MPASVYLDYNSTTPLDPRVADEIHQANLRPFLNPGSQHQLGQRARKYLEQCKTEIVRILGGHCDRVDADRIVITSGGTESNNLALIGGGQFQKRTLNRTGIVVSSIEHPSILNATEYLKSQGFDVQTWASDADGVCSIDRLDDLVDENTALVSCMVANHETGVIQPVQQAAAFCQSKGVLFHSDASQGIGKIPLSFADLGVDLMTISPHKFYGPRGVGGLLVRSKVEIDPLLYGGSQQLALRPGTEDIALVAGFLRATQLVSERLEASASIEKLRDLLERRIEESVGEIVINGRNAERLPNTSNIGFANLNRQAILMAADLEGLCFSTGSACASGSSEPSPVLQAMGLDSKFIEGSIRLSLGVDTTREEVDHTVDRFVEIATRLRRSLSAS